MTTKSLLFILLLINLFEQVKSECNDNLYVEDWTVDCMLSGAYNLEKLYSAYISYLDQLLDHPEKLDKTSQDFSMKDYNIRGSYWRMYSKSQRDNGRSLEDYFKCSIIDGARSTNPPITLYRINSRIDLELCNMLFFQPILGVIALYRNPTPQPDQEEGSLDDRRNELELDIWIQNEHLARNDWENDGRWVKEMVRLMKKALTKDQLIVQANLFVREMIYTKLSRAAPNAFPMEGSPFKKFNFDEKVLYEYVRNTNDAKLRELFSLKMDNRVVEFCKNEKSNTPLCSIATSIMAVKNKYEQTLLNLPMNPALTQSKSKPTLPVSISAYYGQDGLYKTFKDQLEGILEKEDFTATINELGSKLGQYFGKLAEFDNAIANADMVYITTAIANNNASLATNVEKMKSALEAFKIAKTVCALLDILETMVKVAVAVTATVCTAGAAAPAAAAQATIGIEAAFKLAEIAAETVNGVVAKTDEDNKFKNSIIGIKGGVGNIMEKLKKNQKDIEGMAKVVEALHTGSPLKSIEKEVNEFLLKYNAYEPSVTKTDLAQLNFNYTDMLDNMDKTSSGFLCTMFAGGKMAEEIKKAKLAWASINSLLDDILGQQFELITAFVKAVRSKLDKTASEELKTGIPYGFAIIFRQMLDLRVVAQQFCDTRMLMDKNVEDDMCKKIKGKVFLSNEERNYIMENDQKLIKELEDLGSDNEKINERYFYIPVISEGTSPGSINWDDLLDKKGAEFVIPTDKKFLEANGWIDVPDELTLLKSFELFLPNFFEARGSTIQFVITALQDNITITDNPKGQRYTIVTRSLVQTRSKYNLNKAQCGGTVKDDFYVKKGTNRYCIPKDSGRLTNGLKISLPVLMYSKIRIQIEYGLDDNDRSALREQFRPFGDTLKLRGRIRLYSNPAGGFASSPDPVPLGKHRSMAKSRRLDTNNFDEPTQQCGDGQYRQIIDTSIEGQKCKPCPTGSSPVALGSYCAIGTAAKTLG